MVIENLDQVLLQTRECKDALPSAAGTNHEFALEDEPLLAESILEKFGAVKQLDAGLVKTTSEHIEMFMAYAEESEQTLSKALLRELGFSTDERTLMNFM